MTAKCPRCFSHLGADLYAWECVGSCQPRPDPAASAIAGGKQLCRPLNLVQRPTDQRRWQPPVTAAVKCRECRQNVREVCPFCHVALLPGWRDMITVCIALGGARATGKSVYLGVAMKQLHHLLTQSGLALQFGNESTRQIYVEVYERVLFEQRGIMRPTAKIGTEGTYQSVPLIWTYELPGRGRVGLVIRDVAGEDLENATENAPHLSYFPRADAALFLFDPSAVAEVRELLRDLLPAQQNAYGNPEIAFGTMLRLLGQSPVPVGVVMSKFDTIQALKSVDNHIWKSIMANPGLALNRDPGSQRLGFDEHDGALVSAEVSSLLHLLHARGMMNALAHGARRDVRFFATSALGDSTRGDRLHPRGIAPYRCLDPLRWAMSLNGAA